MRHKSIPRADQTTISISSDTGETFRRLVKDEHQSTISVACNNIISWWCDQPYPVRSYVLGAGVEHFRDAMANHLAAVADAMLRKSNATGADTAPDNT